MFLVFVYFFVHFRATKSGHTLILQFFGMQIIAKLFLFLGHIENFSQIFSKASSSGGKIDAGKVSLNLLLRKFKKFFIMCKIEFVKKLKLKMVFACMC